MISGVVFKELRTFTDERGYFREILRVTDDVFHEGFGQCSHSMMFDGVAKAWHLHQEMALNYAVPVGNIKMVLFDDREGSGTRGQLMEIFTGPDDYKLIHVPPRVWNGFKGIGTVPALVANCATVGHSRDEIVRLDPFSGRIPYDWALKHG